MNPERSRILILTTSYPAHEKDPSGIFIAQLAKGIAELGYRIEILAPTDGTVFGNRELFDIPTLRFDYFFPRSLIRLTAGSGGIPENIARSRLARIQVPFMMAAFLLHAIRLGLRSNVLYANWLGAGIVGAVAGFFIRRPLVVSFRGDDGYLARDRPLWRRLTLWVCARAAVIAPVSAELRDILIELGVPAGKIRLPTFGVDTELFRPSGKEQTAPEGTFRILFVGSLIPRKRPEDLLRAISGSEFDETETIFVGDGFLKPDLEALAEQLGIVDRVTWKGTVPQPKVAELMRSADVLCLPSAMEGTPNSVKEAMAAGLPVIASRVGGVPQLVKHGETGLLHDIGDVDTLREHLSTLTKDRDRARAMGRAGRARVESSALSWESTAKDFDEIFSEVTAKQP